MTVIFTRQFHSNQRQLSKNKNKRWTRRQTFPLQNFGSLYVPSTTSSLPSSPAPSCRPFPGARESYPSFRTTDTWSMSSAGKMTFFSSSAQLSWPQRAICFIVPCQAVPLPARWHSGIQSPKGRTVSPIRRYQPQPLRGAHLQQTERRNFKTNFGVIVGWANERKRAVKG